MAVPMVSFAKGVTFGGFTCGVALFRVASVALRDIQTCFVTCRKSFCVAGAIPFVTFSEDALQFWWQAQHFGCVYLHFAWHAQHFRQVVLRVFFANRIVRATSSGDKVQIPW